jgi:tRNA-splicing ligase RtcB
MSNYEVMSGKDFLVKSWTRGVPVEDAARQQLERVARLPFVFKWLAVMPDVHAGIGATVGTVIATQGAVVPACVGVDIGCGMTACRIDRVSLPFDDLSVLRNAIEAAIPHGRTEHGGIGDKGAWSDFPDHVFHTWNVHLRDEYAQLCEKHPALAKANNVAHLGTLGTGNHFCEISEDERGCIWVVIHSGSRGVGGKIGSYFTGIAKEECTKWFVKLEDPNLAYFPEDTALFGDYMRAVQWAQKFARLNRSLMIESVLGVLNATAVETIDCHHNFVEKEHHFGTNVLVTRKGAVRAREGDMGIIPGSMGAKSFIVRGKGNRDSFCSCSHGAGRAMSRTEAKRRFTVEDHAAATAGVECRKDAEVVDETPMAYKSIDSVMAAQDDLVEVVHALKQFVCVKG